MGPGDFAAHVSAGSFPRALHVKGKFCPKSPARRCCCAATIPVTVVPYRVDLQHRSLPPRLSCAHALARSHLPMNPPLHRRACAASALLLCRHDALAELLADKSCAAHHRWPPPRRGAVHSCARWLPAQLPLGTPPSLRGRHCTTSQPPPRSDKALHRPASSSSCHLVCSADACACHGAFALCRAVC
jgi:hypothetical protein